MGDKSESDNKLEERRQIAQMQITSYIPSLVLGSGTLNRKKSNRILESLNEFDFDSEPVLNSPKTT